MHVLTEPTSISSGDQLVASPLNSGGLPTMMSGFAPAESIPRRPELQVVFALYRKDLYVFAAISHLHTRQQPHRPLCGRPRIGALASQGRPMYRTAPVSSVRSRRSCSYRATNPTFAQVRVLLWRAPF